MNPSRWPQVKQIFQEALDRPRQEREAYAREACGEDQEVLAEVLSLLASEEEAGDFLREDAAEYVRADFEDATWTDTNLGRRIGPYQVIRQIGAGGMGAVYLAERVDEFRKTVALKLMKRDVASPAVMAQFRSERQLLAGLEHPNLARLLDGGATDDGNPYFVLEYVDGVSITDYCSQHATPIEDRLKLFRQVCSAVRYAHENLIVHRDIKPGNILVTGDGTPKLLDFGIAKLLRQDAPRQASALTEVGMHLMTPAYASPEQIRGLPITTGTDVYSLGVVLYELLTGQRPFEADTAPELLRMVCEEEPCRPSAVAAAPAAHHLSGDLDTIVLTAMEKDPRRRYSSVEALSGDIRRYLEKLPITARPPTVSYRAGKFLRRNRVAVAAGTLVLISLIAGIISTSWQARVAERERLRAERRFNDVRNLSESFLFQFHDMIKNLAGATEARQAVVAKAAEYLNILEKESAGDTGLQLDLAEANLRLGDVQGNPTLRDKGDPKGALVRYDKALDLSRQVIGFDPHNAAALRVEARAWMQRGTALLQLRRGEDALASARKAVAGFEGLVKSHPEDKTYLINLSDSYETLGDSLNPGVSRLADPDGMEHAYRKALEIWNGLLEKNPLERNGTRARADLTMKLGDARWYQGKMDQSRDFYAQAFTIVSQANTEEPEIERLRDIIRMRLAEADAERNPSESIRQFRRAIESREKLWAADRADRRAMMDLAVALYKAAHVYESLPQGMPDAIKCYRRALEVLAGMQAVAGPQAMAADIGLQLGRDLEQQGDKAGAIQASSDALQLLRQLADRSVASERQYGDYADYADALLHVEPTSLRRPEVALQYARTASDLAHGKDAKCFALMAEANYQAGHARDAAAALEQALALLPKDSPRQASWEELLKQYRAAVGRQ